MTSSAASPSGDREQSGHNRPEAEQARLRALRRYEVVGTEPEPNFDRITRVAASFFDVPIALINFVAEDRQWYKSAVGVESGGRDLESSFCIEAIRSGGTTVIEDAAETERFSDHPLVKGPPGVRFYAGAPLRTPDGYRIGTLCVLDTDPRQLSDEEAGRLEDLAEMVMSELELRRTTRQKLQEKDERLQSIAENVSEGIYRSTPDGELVHANQAFAEMFGYDSVGEILEVGPEDLYADPAERARVLENTNEQDGLEGEDIEFRRADGSTFVGRVTDTVVRGDDGEVAYYDGVIADVTEKRRQERALRRQKALLEQTQRLAGAWEVDLGTETVSYSEEACHIHEMETGADRTLEEAIEFFAPEARPKIRAALRRCIEDEEPYDLELPINTAKGNRRWVRTVGAPAETDGGEVVKVAGALQDITEQKRRKQKLERQNDLFRRAQEIARVGAWEYDVQAEEGTMTEQAYHIYGLSPSADKTSQQTLSFYHPEDRPVIREAYSRAIEEGEPYDLELRVVTDAGEERWVRTRGEPQQGEDQEIARVRGTIQDITEQKRRERELRKSKRRFEALFNDSNILAGLLGKDGKLLEVNQTALSYVEEGQEEVIGELFWETPWWTDQMREAIREKVLQAAGGEYVEYEADHVRPDGSSHTVTGVIRPVTDETGSVVSLFVTARDITERKRRELKLRESRRELREEKRRIQAITENVSDGIYRSTEEEGIAYANQAFIEMFGYRSLEELKEAGTGALYANPSRREELFEKEAEEGELDREEVRFRRKDGTTFVGLVNTQQVEGEEEGKTYFDGAVTDITERKRHEEKLKRRQRDIEALYEATRGLLRADSREAVYDRIHGVLWRVFDYDLVNTGFLEEGTIRSVRTDRSGSAEVPAPNPRPADGNSIAAQILQGEETVVVKDVGSLENEVDYGALRSVAGVPIGDRGVIIMGRAEAKSFDRFNLRLVEVLAGYAALVLGRLEREDELRDAKEEAEEAARLKTSMLANMSHEIRTPLTSIIGFSEAIGEEIETLEDRSGAADLSQLTRFATLIEQAGTRLLETLNSVLNLSKLEAEEVEMNARSIDLAEQIRQAVSELKPKAKEAGLDLIVEAGETPARADEGGVQIVLQNLLSNAIKYTGEGGEVRVRAYQNGDEGAIMEVEDTGIGMEPEVAETLFEPFRQASEGLDRDYEGTGIGLAVVRRAVEQMGGTVDVETQKGEGSRFTVRLPRAD